MYVAHYSKIFTPKNKNLTDNKRANIQPRKSKIIPNNTLHRKDKAKLHSYNN